MCVLIIEAVMRALSLITNWYSNERVRDIEP
jgi:hypothetical protein